MNYIATIIVLGSVWAIQIICNTVEKILNKKEEEK